MGPVSIHGFNYLCAENNEMDDTSVNDMDPYEAEIDTDRITVRIIIKLIIEGLLRGLSSQANDAGFRILSLVVHGFESHPSHFVLMKNDDSAVSGGMNGFRRVRGIPSYCVRRTFRSWRP